MNDYIITPPQ